MVRFYGEMGMRIEDFFLAKLGFVVNEQQSPINFEKIKKKT